MVANPTKRSGFFGHGFGRELVHPSNLAGRYIGVRTVNPFHASRERPMRDAGGARLLDQPVDIDQAGNAFARARAEARRFWVNGALPPWWAYVSVEIYELRHWIANFLDTTWGCASRDAERKPRR